MIFVSIKEVKRVAMRALNACTLSMKIVSYNFNKFLIKKQ